MKITDELYNEVMLKYGFALNVLETNIKIMLNEYEYKNKNNIVDHIKVRLKSKDSACKKLQKKGYDTNIDNLVIHVHDLVGLRIVCPFLSDVYTVVNIIKNSKLFSIKDEKDYIANPKDTGYISYHLIVLVPIPIQDVIEYVEAEIQIRTMAMDFWASLDHKLQYKFIGEIPNDVKNEMQKCSMDIKIVDAKMQALKEFITEHANEK
ncbi:MAG TPA: GTP pyrophosphokinase family protein [Bacilli bacterium]|nr:GTP pyrophosphokinase family protein [Bacilli bacterium]